MTITLTREEAQEILEALTYVGDAKVIYSDTIETLRARLAQPEPEPVAWMQNDMEHFSLWPDEWHVVPLYTVPPQREFIVLTDEEIAGTSVECAVTTPSDIYFARAIEAKLREKNFG